MKTQVVITLTTEDLKKILCKHFNLQEPKSIVRVNTMSGDRPGEMSTHEIELTANK